MLWLWVLLIAKPFYTGYAGSPVSNGSCAATCHGSGSFSLQVSGFPSTYTPGETYEITVSTSGGTIKNFNACVLDESNQPQGTLQAGLHTTTYTHSGEGTGIRGISYDQATYTFYWTAPDSPVGSVKLYVAAHRGGYSGPNRSLVLTSEPQAVAETGSGAPGLPLAEIPSLALQEFRIVLNPTSGPVDLTIVSANGALLRNWTFARLAHRQVITWSPGQGIPAGIYRVRVQSGRRVLSRSVVYLPR